MGNEVSKKLLLQNQKQQFDEEGYVIVKGLLSTEEVAEIKNTFMNLHAREPIPNCFSPVSEEEAKGDILKRYPRMMHPHRVNDLASSKNKRVGHRMSATCRPECIFYER